MSVFGFVTKLNTRRQVGNRPGSWLATFRRLTLLFSIVYLILFFLVVLHTHDGEIVARPTLHAGVLSIPQDRGHLHSAFRAVQQVLPPDCPLCDLLAHPIATPKVTVVVFKVIAQAQVPALLERIQPYLPFRFYTHSSSRAPPVA